LWTGHLKAGHASLPRSSPPTWRRACADLLGFGVNGDPVDSASADEEFLLAPGVDRLQAGAHGHCVQDLCGGAGFTASFRIVTSPCSTADLAEPDNVLDLADVVAFAEAFMAGCP
jgi:hypothetical protein